MFSVFTHLFIRKNVGLRIQIIYFGVCGGEIFQRIKVGKHDKSICLFLSFPQNMLSSLQEKKSINCFNKSYFTTHFGVLKKFKHIIMKERHQLLLCFQISELRSKVISGFNCTFPSWFGNNIWKDHHHHACLFQWPVRSGFPKRVFLYK